MLFLLRDARTQSKFLSQYLPQILKSYSAFALHYDVLADYYPSVATGNWGCGSSNGNPQLKALVQWIAASLAGRKVRAGAVCVCVCAAWVWATNCPIGCFLLYGAINKHTRITHTHETTQHHKRQNT